MMNDPPRNFQHHNEEVELKEKIEKKLSGTNYILSE